MTTSRQLTTGRWTGRDMLNKVPEVTLFFWVIKILCTTVGETAADYLNDNLGFGLSNTTYFTGALLAVILLVQFRLRRYVPVAYWAVVVVISVFGTLLTDNLSDNYNVPLTTTTPICAAILALVFTVWYAVERTLSIHSIVTLRREAFYWAAILFTFALGTAVGDLVDEKFGLGYWPTAVIVGLLIGAVAASHLAFGANAVLTFWMAYVLTRPLGASLGDGFAQAPTDGGLGLGTTWTSLLFLVTILVVVAYLAVSKRDQTVATPAEIPEMAGEAA